MKHIFYYIFIFIFLLILVIWMAGAMNDSSEHLLNSTSLNTLFAGLAFLGILSALYIQQNEILDNRKDIEKQKELNTIQMFENGFFMLLNNYRVSREEIEHNGLLKKILVYKENDMRIQEFYPPPNIKGIEFFRNLGTCFYSALNNDILNYPEGKEIFFTAHYILKDKLIYFTNNFELLVNYIIMSELSRTKKLYYLNIIVAQAYNFELEWFFVHSIFSKNIAFKMFKEFPEIRNKISYHNNYDLHFKPKSD